ncbi:STM3941 family protein [Flavobacterium aquidurense]|uniref:STM3941 family protein n=1 Tax=Flavobacterium aquidurense TaxID=362413 RepID=UPI003757CDBC
MNEEHFYSNKLISFLLLLISSIFVIVGILLGEKMIDFEEKLFKSVIFIFSFLLFSFGIVLSFLLLGRKKPLLTITNSEIIIHNVLTPSKTIQINNIKSFFIVNTNYRGIKTNRQIFIELNKPTEKYTKTWFYKFLNKISKPIANSQYSIQTDFLNIKQQKLLELLNKKIKNAV